MTARPMLKVSQGTLTQPSEQATALALTAEPSTFPADSYALAMWLDTARKQALEEAAKVAEAGVTYVVGEERDLCDRLASSIRALGSQNDG